MQAVSTAATQLTVPEFGSSRDQVMGDIIVDPLLSSSSLLHPQSPLANIFADAPKAPLVLQTLDIAVPAPAPDLVRLLATVCVPLRPPHRPAVLPPSTATSFRLKRTQLMRPLFPWNPRPRSASRPCKGQLSAIHRLRIHPPSPGSLVFTNTDGEPNSGRSSFE